MLRGLLERERATTLQRLADAVPALLQVENRSEAPDFDPQAYLRELRSELNAQMAESINGMPVLQASNATGRFNQRFADLNAALVEAGNNVYLIAVPPIATRPAGTLAKDLGTSTRAMVLMGPRSDQPRVDQYALKSANRVTSRSTSHLVADT